MIWWILLWVLLAVLALTVFVFFLPVGVRVSYRQEKLSLWVVVGPIRYLIPLKKTDKKKDDRDDRKSIEEKTAEPEKKRKYDEVLKDYWSQLKTILALFQDLRPKIRIKRLQLKLYLAGENPALLALEYGGAWAAIGGLLPLLEESFILKKRELDVDCDFSGSKTTLDAQLDISIGLGRLLMCLVRYIMNTYNQSDAKPTAGKLTDHNQSEEKNTERR